SRHGEGLAASLGGGARVRERKDQAGSQLSQHRVRVSAVARALARRKVLMIKLLELWTPRPDMTHEQAVRHWTEVKAPVVKKTFGDKILKYVTNVGLPLDTHGWSRNEAPLTMGSRSSGST